jgi:hypothetical protein
MDNYAAHKAHERALVAGGEPAIQDPLLDESRRGVVWDRGTAGHPQRRLQVWTKTAEQILAKADRPTASSSRHFRRRRAETSWRHRQLAHGSRGRACPRSPPEPRTRYSRTGRSRSRPRGRRHLRTRRRPECRHPARATADRVRIRRLLPATARSPPRAGGEDLTPEQLTRATSLQKVELPAYVVRTPDLVRMLATDPELVMPHSNRGGGATAGERGPLLDRRRACRPGSMPTCRTRAAKQRGDVRQCGAPPAVDEDGPMGWSAIAQTPLDRLICLRTACVRETTVSPDS